MQKAFEIPVNSSSTWATATGSLAILLWGFSALINLQLLQLPVFQILCTLCTTSFVATIAYITYRRSWHRLKQPASKWLICIIGLLGTDLGYISAFKHAPAAHVEIITYLWPLFVVLGTYFLPHDRATFRHLLAACLGLLGMYFLLFHEVGSIQRHHLPGYLAALGAALVWAGYILCTRYRGPVPSEMIGVAFGLGAILACALHLQLEVYTPPSALQWCWMVVLGLSSHLVAYCCWQHGVNHGNYKLLSILSYFTVLLSVLLLVLFAQTQASTELFISCTLVMAAAILATRQERRDTQSADITQATAASPPF